MTPLSDHHLAQLAASGITPEQADARGYETIRDPRRLAELGIAKGGQRTQGVLVPMLRADGSTWGWQYRPDHPRERRGKLVKYETSTGQRNGIDVPPGVGPMLGDPNVPLWVTEGVKKADCAAVQGLCIVALPGVWSWRGTNGSGGKVAVGDWHDIALNGRRVILAFDGDVARKPEVHKAMSALADYLASKGAKVEYLHLPDTADKTGLDDFLADHSVEELWRLVKPTQPTPAQPAMPAEPVERAELAMPAEPIDGAELLDDVLAVLKRYVVFADEHQPVAVALWIAATHALSAFECAARLIVTSPEKRCGKTRLLDVINGTCHKPLATVNATVAAVFRSINGDHPPTLIIDEADTIFGSKKAAENHEDLRALLNAGHQRGRPALRCVGPTEIPTEFNTFAMAALAGIGTMPDTITDRAVNITMRRRAGTERVSQFRSRRDGPILSALRDRIATWAEHLVDELSKAEPVMPVEDRAADTWEPLIAIADAAGGHWPSSGRAACKALVAAAEAADEEQSLAVKLLGDIRQIFIDSGQSFLASNVLVRELHGIEDSPWADFGLTPRKLAYRLKDFGVRPGFNAAKTLRGYRIEHLTDAFSRYISPQPSKPSETAPHQERPLDASESPDGSIRPVAFIRPGENTGQALFSHDRTDTDGSPTGDATHPAPAEHTDTTPSAPPGAPTASTPGMTPRVERIVMKARDARSSPGFTPPAGSGRCDNCGFHIATQGHRDGCTRERVSP